MATKTIYHQRIANRQCVECGTTEGIKDRWGRVCEKCRVLKNNRAKKHYQKLRALEICVRCRRHKTSHNKVSCYWCNHSLNQYGKWIQKRGEIQNDKYFWLHAKQNKKTLLHSQYLQQLQDAKNNVLDTLMQCNYHITEPKLCNTVRDILDEYETDIALCTVIKNHLLHLYKQDQEYAEQTPVS